MRVAGKGLDVAGEDKMAGGEGRVSAAAVENELGQMRDVCTGELDQVSR